VQCAYHHERVHPHSNRNTDADANTDKNAYKNADKSAENADKMVDKNGEGSSYEQDHAVSKTYSKCGRVDDSDTNVGDEVSIINDALPCIYRRGWECASQRSGGWGCGDCWVGFVKGWYNSHAPVVINLSYNIWSNYVWGVSG
jgi:hypothetical protein